MVSAKLAGDAAGVTVIRNDFSDPQGGKGVCDRQAATIKGDIGRYVNEGNDVMNGEQLKAAIESGQGTTGVKASYVAANTSRTPSVKWDGISLLNNFQYEEKGVRAWRAFNVGPQEVSKSMGLERDQGGARIFHPDEVLTAQQITSFFGRLAAKKQLLETTPTESDNDGNDSAAEAEAYHSTLCTYVRKRCLSSASGCVIRFQCM